MTNYNYYVTELFLNNFRNYQFLDLNIEHNSVFIAGHNGAGKTTILEAISMLSPGKGMRNASHEEIKYHNKENWAISSNVTFNNEEHKLGTALVNSNDANKRIIKIDGELIKSANELTNYISLLWLTPQMDSIFLSGIQNRRKYLDRMVYNFDPNHAKRITEYEKKIKERQLIIKVPNYDINWIEVIEEQIANLNYEITLARLNIIKLVDEQIKNYNSSFPKLKLSLECAVLKEIENHSNNSIKRIKEVLERNRKMDFFTGRTNFGCHKSDLVLKHFISEIPITNCSTGEQKAMLITLTLCQALAKVNLNKPAPILLLDEILAHLDYEKRREILDFIGKLKMQAWVTSTDTDFWNEINYPSQLLIVENASIKKQNSIR